MKGPSPVPSTSNEPDRHPFVSIIIPVLDDADNARRCLQYLAKQTFPSDRFEMIIVDNGSSNDLGLLAEFDRAKLVVEPKPGSYAARNRGVREARGTILGFTDAICKPEPHWIEHAVSLLVSDSSKAYLAGKTIFEFSDPDDLHPAEVYQWVNWGRQKEHLEDYGFAACANLFARRELFENVGPFDETLMTGGDFEWGRRVRAYGAGQIYCDDAVVIHPSRKRVREIVVQEARRFDGIYQLIRRGAPGARGLIRSLFFALFSMPGWRRLTKERRARLRTVAETLTYLAVAELLRWTRVIEWVRMSLGASPRRK